MEKKGKHPLIHYIALKFNNFLSKTDSLPRRTYLYDFEQMTKEIQPADVILIESHTHIGNLIRLISESPWTHAALYVGKPSGIKDPELRQKIIKLAEENNLKKEHLLIESLIGKGTLISTLEKYKNDHLRILRPSALLPEDAQSVIDYAIRQIGVKYSLRHLFDLARFIFPWRVFPRKWRSSLFQQTGSQPTEDICSSMIANAFQSVNYPILPVIEEDQKGTSLIHRNPCLYTPSDFDVSPFFDIIKYPIFPFKKGMSYRELPWINKKLSNE